MMYRTVILEEESLLREGLRLILSKTPFAPSHVGTIDYRSDVLRAVEPELIIVVGGASSNFVGHIIALRHRHPAARIVALVERSRREWLPLALEAGANGALFTSISAECLIAALHAVVMYNVLVVDGALRSLSPANKNEGRGTDPSFDDSGMHDERKLSTREHAILDRIVMGDSNKQIARHFAIAEATVKAHVKAILRKIGVGNRTQAAIWFINNKQTATDKNDLPVSVDSHSTAIARNDLRSSEPIA